MVETELATQERLDYIFDTVLKESILPVFQVQSRTSTISKSREYVAKVLKEKDLLPTFPPPSQDWLVAGFRVSGGEDRGSDGSGLPMFKKKSKDFQKLPNVPFIKSNQSDS
jgi:hypothetical protein